MALPRLGRTKGRTDLDGLAPELEETALTPGALVSWQRWTAMGKRTHSGLLIALEDLSCIMLNERGRLQRITRSAPIVRWPMKNADNAC